MIKSLRHIIVLHKQPCLTLPKGWARFFNLKKKQKLLVLGDQVLVIFPPNSSKGLEKRVREFLIK
jgi:bifunctional DNA-binding transcriptional regulator/antitoxin component of YhaV-PrlF toxin-antitoxin module